jgi:hypothetical protein
MRSFRYQQLWCRWAVSGPQLPVHVLVIEMVGYDAPWFLVTSALDLTAAQIMDAWAARFRQEDSFRDHKQRLGMEEGRAWTKEPSLRAIGRLESAASAAGPPRAALGSWHVVAQASVASS